MHIDRCGMFMKRKIQCYRQAALLAAAGVLVVGGSARAQYTPIYGSLTFDAVSGNGYVDVGTAALNDSGVAVGVARKYLGGISQGDRAVRWGPMGSALELPNLGTNAS